MFFYVSVFRISRYIPVLKIPVVFVERGTKLILNYQLRYEDVRIDTYIIIREITQSKLQPAKPWGIETTNSLKVFFFFVSSADNPFGNAKRLDRFTGRMWELKALFTKVSGIPHWYMEHCGRDAVCKALLR